MTAAAGSQMWRICSLRAESASREAAMFLHSYYHPRHPSFAHLLLLLGENPPLLLPTWGLLPPSGSGSMRVRVEPEPLKGKPEAFRAYTHLANNFSPRLVAPFSALNPLRTPHPYILENCTKRRRLKDYQDMSKIIIRILCKS